MKKTVKVAVSTLLALTLCACGSSGSGQPAASANGAEDAQATAENTEANSEAAAEELLGSVESEDALEGAYDPNVKSIDLTLEKGSIRFDHVEKANQELTDSDKALIFVFEFTNEQDIPAQAQSAFRFQFFQNGAELTNNLTYNSRGGDQYELVGAFFNDAMKGGTVTFGKIVEPKDDSPITIMVSPNGAALEDNYQMMEVAIDGSENAEDDSADVSAEDIVAALQGTWQMGDDGTCTFDKDTVTLANDQATVSGTYDLNLDKSAIIGHLQATDGTVDFALLYDYDGKTVRVFRDIDKKDELTKL